MFVGTVVHEGSSNVNARLALSELYKETGNYDAAIAIVSHTSVPLGTLKPVRHASPLMTFLTL